MWVGMAAEIHVAGASAFCSSVFNINRYFWNQLSNLFFFLSLDRVSLTVTLTRVALTVLELAL